MAAVAFREIILLVWKSQTYFGQLYVCVWFLSYLVTLMGMEILHFIKNNLVCNHTLPQPNVHVMCPEYDNFRLQRRSTFMICYGVFPFAIWFLYTAYSVSRLRKFRTHQISTPLCNLYAAYFVQLFTKLLVHVLMLFIFISHVQFWFPVRLHCSLQNVTDSDMNDMKPIENITCTDKYRVPKSVMQATLLTVLAALTLISLAELVYIMLMMRSRSTTVFVAGDEDHPIEPLDNGCLCSCMIPSDGQFILFRLHLRRIGPEPKIESEDLLAKYFEDMKHFYLEKTQYADNFHLANTRALKLDDIFTKPIVTDVRRPKSSVKNSCVQKKSTDNAEDISNFLLTGKAGMGKTTFAQKIIRQWAKGESGLSNKIKIVLCLDFNSLEDAKSTVCLRELIRDQIPLEFTDFVKGNPSAILIVVDNVGESKTEAQETDFENTFEDEMPFPVMLKKFLTGKLLKGATIITLSRLSNISYSQLFCVENQAEIVGYSPQSIKEYIKGYFSSSGTDVDLDRLMLMFTDDSLSICCVPSNCFYMCSFLKWLGYPDNASVVEKGGSIPDSLTQLYLAVMQMISPIKKQLLSSATASNSVEALPSLTNSSGQLHEESSSNGAATTDSQGSSHRLACANNGAEPSPETHCTPHNLDNIYSSACSLAMRSIDEGKATFTLDELRSVLSDKDVPIYFRPIEVDKDGQETHFSFRWGYLQEFLAAYFIVSDYSLTRFESLVKQVKEDISSKRDQVLQFACGLLFELSQFSDKTKKKAIHPITELDNVSQPYKRRQKELQLVMIKCLAEVKDYKLSREAASKFIPVVEFPCCDIGVAECSALAYVLGTSPFASIRSIDLSDNKISVMGIRQLTQKLLLPGKGPTEELNVKGNTLGDQGLKELTEALKKKECRLKILNLADNGVTSAGVSKLSSALDSNTFLEELNLSYNGICREGVAQLATALRKEKTKVSRLNLSYNNIGDEGVASLESVRQSSLNLARNNITINGIHPLVTLFPTLTNLEELDLSGNIIESVGLEALLPCLMIPGCRIKCLGFNFCKLEDEGVVHCAKVLTLSQNQISSLSLAGNSITNDGVGEIAKAFASPECKVKCLNLSSNRIGDEGVEALSLSLGSPNCDLRELDLSRNLIENKGCKCLAAAIRKRNCLQRLALQGNKVGDEGASHLLSAVRIHNCKLHSLILDENDISDEGISGLPHAFSSPHCKLGSLRLRKNLISRNSLETLAEAMSSPFCRLEQLALDESV